MIGWFCIWRPSNNISNAFKFVLTNHFPLTKGLVWLKSGLALFLAEWGFGCRIPTEESELQKSVRRSGDFFCFSPSLDLRRSESQKKCLYSEREQTNQDLSEDWSCRHHQLSCILFQVDRSQLWTSEWCFHFKFGIIEERQVGWGWSAVRSELTLIWRRGWSCDICNLNYQLTWGRKTENQTGKWFRKLPPGLCYCFFW